MCETARTWRDWWEANRGACYQGANAGGGIGGIVTGVVTLFIMGLLELQFMSYGAIGEGRVQDSEVRTEQVGRGGERTIRIVRYSYLDTDRTPRRG